MSTITVPKGTVSNVAEAKVVVNGSTVPRALIDTGAAVTVINKKLVDSLNLVVTSTDSGHMIKAANDELMPVKGFVDITIQLVATPIRVYALYVPEISFPLIIGTNVLYAAGARIVCEGEVIWPRKELSRPGVSDKADEVLKGTSNRVTTALVEPPGQLVMSVQRAVIKPLSGMNVKAKVKGVVKDGDYLIESTKFKLSHGQVPLQLRTVKDGYVDVFITNTSHNVCLSISGNLPIAYASDNVKIWCDEKGEALTLDALEEKTNAAKPNDSSNSVKTTDDSRNTDSAYVDTSKSDKSPDDMPRKIRRKVLKLTRKIEKMRLKDSNERVTSIKDAHSNSKPVDEPSSSGIAKRLTEEQRKIMIEFLEEYKDLFSVDIRSTTPLVTHRIYTDGPPRKQRAYWTPISQKAFVSKYIQDSLEAGIIRPSSSPWSSPILLVQKKDGTKRFCVDYRQLNSVTKKDVYPIPRIEDVLERLDGMKYFTTLDLVQSYYQIAVAEEDKEKTAFITEEGSYEYNVMPFGLTNAPATFQRLMNLVLAGLNWKMCLVYIDDILIFSRTFEEHMVHLRCVFDRLRNANLKLKRSKCSFGEDSTTYLGHKIDFNGVSPDPTKIEAINKLDIDLWQSVTDVKAFLGMTGYYRRFIRGYASISRPLTELLRKNAPFCIDSDVRRSFNRLKKALAKQPVLAYPRLNVPFVLQVDASDYGMGGVLTQYYDNSEHPIAYFSKKFSDSERKYAIMERECLAMVESIKHFRAYLYGQKFVVMTDHKPLEHIDSFKNHNGRVARWRMTLSDYHFDVIARPGAQNANADGLSRLPVNLIQSYDTFADTVDPKELAKLQSKDRTLRKIIAYLKDDHLPNNRRVAKRILVESELYCMVDGVLYHGYYPQRKHSVTAGLRLVVPEQYREEILHYFHNDPLGAHQGIQRTFDLIASRYFWPKMYKSISDHVRSCVKCIAKKTPRVLKAGKMQAIEAKHPFDIVGVDILGPLPMTPRKYRYILSSLTILRNSLFASA